VSRKKIPNKAALIEVLSANDGNMAAAGRYFGCSRQVVWQYVDKDPKLRELCAELSESFTDECEAQLFEKIREGDTACIIFYMKTRGRDRGYSERLELMPLAPQQIEVELGSPTNQIENEDDHTQAQLSDTTAIALLEQ